MIISHNIDRTDEALNTKAPFEWRCPLEIAKSVMPSGAFLSIKVYCSEDVKPPVRLHNIKTAGSEGVVEFRDSEGTLIGTWQLQASLNYFPLVSSFIFGKDGTIRGQVTCDYNTPAFLLATTKQGGGSIVTSADDFVLLPSCHVPYLNGICKSFSIGGKQSTADAVITPTTRTKASFNNNGAFTVGLMSEYKEPVLVNGISTLIVNNEGSESQYAVGNKHLVLNAGITSNLRVRTTGSTIQLKGVMDE